MPDVTELPPVRIIFSEQDRQEISKRMDQILSTGRLTLGPFGEEFEHGFAKLCRTKCAVAVSGGTSSLEIVLRSWGITSGNVVVPTNTFFATPAAVRHAGANVKFVDMNPHTLAPSLDQLKAARDRETRAVIMVHIGGTLSDELPAIRTWCDREGLCFLEDAAHAHGSTLNGKAAGSFGHAASFSFYPTKVMTSAEGGMILTDDEQLAIDARRYRDQGKESFAVNLHTRLGHNWRMSEVHAAIGLQQLKRLPEFLAGRRKAGARIHELLAGVDGISTFKDPRGVVPNYYKFMAILKNGIDRAQFKKTLRERKKISPAGEVFDLPCHLQPIFKEDKGCLGKDFPNAEGFCRRHVCLPIYANMTEDEATYLCEGIQEALHG